MRDHLLSTARQRELLLNIASLRRHSEKAEEDLPPEKQNVFLLCEQ